MRIIPGDWLMNAGIVGYLRICERAGDKPNLSKGFLEMSPSRLRRFTESYFTTILMSNGEMIFRFRQDILAEIRSKTDKTKFSEFRSEYERIGNRSFRSIKPNYSAFNTSLRDVIRIAKDFKKQVLNLVGPEATIFQTNNITPERVRKIKKKLDISISKDIQRLQDKSLKFVYVYLQRFYRNKKIVGNPVSKINRKKAFEQKYVQPAINQLKRGEKTKVDSNGFLCRFCKQNRVIPKRFYDVDSFFAEGMFSTTGITIAFRNFFYNMQPDLFVCDVCELLLLCAWAGFTQIPWQFRDDLTNTNYILVNLPLLDLLWKENKKIQQLYEQSGESVQGTIYEDIVKDIFLRSYKTKALWAIENILFIEIKTTARKDAFTKDQRPDFRYFHIGQDVAHLIIDDYASDALRRIRGRITIGNNLAVSLRRNIVRRILDCDSLLPLCYSLMFEFLRTGNASSLRNLFNVLVISCIRGSIAGRGLKSKSMLESSQIYGILRNLQREGSSFNVSLEYDQRKRKSYVLLSMIRNGRVEDFYDVLLKIYMSINRPVPESLISLLNSQDELGFEARAYAFMSGFLGTEQRVALANS